MRIVIVNPNPLRRSTFAAIIAPLAPTAEIVTVPELATARRALTDTVGHVIVVLELDVSRGLAGLEALHREFTDARIVLTSPHALSAATLLEAANCGACGYVPSDARPEVLGNALSAVIDTLRESGAEPTERVVAPAAPAAAIAPRVTTEATERALSLMLTPRQIDVLHLLARGLPNKSIGRELNLAPSTVKAHISAILRSLQARSRTEAVIAAIRHGLVPGSTTHVRPAATTSMSSSFRTAAPAELRSLPTVRYQAEGSGRRSVMAFASI